MDGKKMKGRKMEGKKMEGKKDGSVVLLGSNRLKQALQLLPPVALLAADIEFAEVIELAIEFGRIADDDDAELIHVYGLAKRIVHIIEGDLCDAFSCLMGVAQGPTEEEIIHRAAGPIPRVFKAQWELSDAGRLGFCQLVFGEAVLYSFADDTEHDVDGLLHVVIAGESLCDECACAASGHVAAVDSVRFALFASDGVHEA